MIDFAASMTLVVVFAIAAVGYAVRGRTIHHERVEKDGGSVLLGTGTMNGFYWAIGPIVRACLRLGITADAITYASLALSLAAGALLAFGHFGLAALLTAIASLGDALDGLVARASGTAGPSGEVLDAAVDRYSELFFFGGLAVHYRASPWLLVLVLAASAGAFMVSYASAKAEALATPVPRGAMRRPERAAYLAFGALLVPLVRHEAPMLVALGLVAVVANVSAVRRQSAIARAVSTAPPRARILATLARHQIGSLAATVVDFGTMTLLVELHVATAVQATLFGASLGAITNFILGRSWIFRATGADLLPQALRYGMVSTASALLNTLGEHIVNERLGVQYIVARTVVAVGVSLLWNFPLQRLFVFRARPS
jgi:CDP-diacylglycerol--glycerol-3-phosphate 3-phosphatidyltransferase